MFDNAYKNDQKVHFFVNLYRNICQRNMQKKTVDIIRLIICYSRPGQTVDRDRPVVLQQFGGRSQIFLIQKNLSKLKGVIYLW